MHLWTIVIVCIAFIGVGVQCATPLLSTKPDIKLPRVFLNYTMPNVTTDTSAFTPSVATNGLNNWVVVVMLQSQDPGFTGSALEQDIYFAHSEDNGYTWSNLTYLLPYMLLDRNISAASADRYPTVAASPQGFMVVWSSIANNTGLNSVTSSNDFEILSAFSVDGKNFTGPFLVNAFNDAGLLDTIPSVSSNGSVWLAVWLRTVNSTAVSLASAEVLSAYSSDNGTTWSTPLVLASGSRYQYPNVAFYNSLWIVTWEIYNTNDLVNGIYVKFATLAFSWSTSARAISGASGLVGNFQNDVIYSKITTLGSQDFSSTARLGDAQWFVIYDYNDYSAPPPIYSPPGIMGYRARINTLAQSRSAAWVSAAQNILGALFYATNQNDFFCNPSLACDRNGVWVAAYNIAWRNLSGGTLMYRRARSFNVMVSKDNGVDWNLFDMYDGGVEGIVYPKLATNLNGDYVLVWIESAIPVRVGIKRFSIYPLELCNEDPPTEPEGFVCLDGIPTYPDNAFVLSDNVTDWPSATIVVNGDLSVASTLMINSSNLTIQGILNLSSTSETHLSIKDGQTGLATRIVTITGTNSTSPTNCSILKGTLVLDIPDVVLDLYRQPSRQGFKYGFISYNCLENVTNSSGQTVPSSFDSIIVNNSCFSATPTYGSSLLNLQFRWLCAPTPTPSPTPTPTPSPTPTVIVTPSPSPSPSTVASTTTTTPKPTPATTASSTGNSNEDTTPVIIGATVGGVLFILILAGVVAFIIPRALSNNHDDEDELRSRSGTLGRGYSSGNIQRSGSATRDSYANSRRENRASRSFLDQSSKDTSELGPVTETAVVGDE